MGVDPEATEAALIFACPGRDPVGEFWRGEITFRDLRLLVQNLPHDSAMHRAIPELAGWDTGNYLQANLIDAIGYLGAILVACPVNGGDGNIVPPPPFERPRDAVANREAHEADALAAQEARDWFDESTAHLL